MSCGFSRAAVCVDCAALEKDQAKSAVRIPARCTPAVKANFKMLDRPCQAFSSETSRNKGEP
jgi:hypothetical protein